MSPGRPHTLPSMRNSTINLLTVVIIAIMAFITLAPVAGFCLGLAAGLDKAADSSHATLLPTTVNYRPDYSTLVEPVDSVVTADGTVIPVIPEKGMLLIPGSSTSLSMIVVSLICSTFSFLCFVMFAITLIKIVININRNRIFEKRTASQLRQTAVYLLLMALLQIIAGVCQECSGVLDSIEISGYSLSMSWSIPWDLMLIGFLALLMSQVWRKGIQLKEDQDLTI